MGRDGYRDRLRHIQRTLSLAGHSGDYEYFEERHCADVTMIGKLATLLKLHLEREDGSNLIEYAITLTLYLLLLFGIVDFSRALYAYHFVAHAAREGARWAMVNGSTCHDDPDAPSCPYANGASLSDVTTHITNFVPPGIVSGQITVSACGVNGGGECAASSGGVCAGTVNAPGCVVAVTVQYPFTFIAPIVHVGSITMSSTSQMIIAH